MEPPTDTTSTGTTYALDEIQKQLLLETTTFKLFAVIEYVSAAKHFISHVQRKNGTWETYDDMSQKVKKTIQKHTMDVFMLFYKKEE